MLTHLCYAGYVNHVYHLSLDFNHVNMLISNEHSTAEADGTATAVGN